MSIFPGMATRIGLPISLPALSSQKVSRLLGSAGLSFVLYAFLTEGEAWIIFFPLLMPGLVTYAVLREKGYRVDAVLVPFLGLLVRPKKSPFGKEEFAASMIGPASSLAASFVYAGVFLWTRSELVLFAGAWSAYATLISLVPVLPLQGGVIVSLATEKASAISQAFLILLAFGFIIFKLPLLTALPALLACAWLGHVDAPSPLVPRERSEKLFGYLSLLVFAVAIFSAYIAYIS
jgi:hypothetical protein